MKGATDMKNLTITAEPFESTFALLCSLCGPLGIAISEKEAETFWTEHLREHQ